jgi:calpain-15
MAASVIQREKSRIGLARNIEPKDIVQGELGDCYFLSSIASIISLYPEVIDDKILFSVNNARYYVVKLFIDGEVKMFDTDDQFPCRNGRPVFAQPHGK